MNRRRRSTRWKDLPTGPQLEIHLQARDPLDRTPLLDARRVGQAIARARSGLSPRGPDEWCDAHSRLRALVCEEKLLLLLAPSGKAEALSAELDELLELGFTLAERLGLDLFDVQLGEWLTRAGYERQVSRLRAVYQRWLGIRQAMGSERGWIRPEQIRLEEGAAHPDPLLGSLPALEVEAGLPVHRGEEATLVVSGGRELAALSSVGGDRPYLVALPPGAQAGERGVVLKPNRWCSPESDLLVLEVTCVTSRNLQAVHRGPRGTEVEVAPRGVSADSRFT